MQIVEGEIWYLVVCVEVQYPQKERGDLLCGLQRKKPCEGMPSSRGLRQTKEALLVNVVWIVLQGCG